MQTFFHLHLDGSLTSTSTVISTIEPEQDLVIAILENEITRRDIKLKAEDWNILKRDVDAAKNLLKKFTSLAQKRKPNVNDLDNFKREMEKHLSAIREALTEEQWKRIEQLGVRFSMRLAGPSLAIFTGELGNRLEIPMQDRSELFKVGTRLAEPLRKESSELKSLAIERLTNLLTPDHRTKLELYLKRNHLHPQNINFGILIWQLSNLSELDEKTVATTPLPEIVADDEIGEEFRELNANSDFKLSIAGTFEPASSRIQTKSWLNLKLIELLVEPDIAKPIELTEGQITTFKDALELFHERSNEIDRQFEYAKNRQRAIKQLKVDQAESLEKLDGLVEKVLLPHQIDWLKEYVGRVGVSRIGLVGSLLYGQLGRSIGLTEQDKKALKEEALNIRDELMQESLKLENRIYDELITKLRDKDEKRLKSLIGDPVKEGYSNLDLLADQLSGKGG